MVITGSARIYSIYTSQAVFNGQVIVKISTDGKILIVGTLNFADNNISISGRLYADLSQVASGKVVILFLADFPDQVRLLTLYGKLKMGFRNSSGNEVTFDVVEGADPIATGTAPTVGIGAPTTNGGTVDVGVVNGAQRSSSTSTSRTRRRPERVSTSPASSTAARSSRSGTAATQRTTITGKPVPIVAVTTAGGMVFVELRTDATGAYYMLDATRVDVLLVADLESGDLLETAVRITGTTRFRYAIGADDLGMGRWEVRFAAGAVKNTDLTTDAGTTVGAGSAATTLAFTVVGATATVVNPTPNASVDINVINGRAWITVTFTNPTLFTIDPASITDLAAEFQLSGPGLGTIQLDGTQAPQLVSSTATTATYRYWLTGRFADTGAVNITYLANSWSYLFTLSGALTITDAPTETGAGSIGVLFPAGGQLGLPAGFTVDPDSVIGRLLAAQLALGGTGWALARDMTAPITTTDTPGEFRIPVMVTTVGTGPVTATLNGAHARLPRRGRRRLAARRHPHDHPDGVHRRRLRAAHGRRCHPRPRLDPRPRARVRAVRRGTRQHPARRRARSAPAHAGVLRRACCDSASGSPASSTPDTPSPSRPWRRAGRT